MVIPRWHRVLLKLSGESFCKEGELGIQAAEVKATAESLAEVHAAGVELAVVVGGGNLMRGASLSEQGIARTSADYMGMLGTLINAVALQEALEKLSIPTRIQSAIAANQVAEPFIRRRCIRHLEKGRIVILAGGTGLPLFTTDTTATLRAKEIEAEVVLKATKVDGVYDSDPKKNSTAVFFKTLSYSEVLRRNLQVMDATAITLAMEHGIPIIVFNVKIPGNIKRAVLGEQVGTLITL
jgi:uridylate kinase